MNKILLCGRLVNDPEVRWSQGAKATAIARYTLAVDRKFKQDGQPTADFINCVALGKNGEFAEKYLKKGTKVIVTGRWQTGSYTNRDGQKVYTNECMVEEHEFAESRTSSNAAPTSNVSGGITPASNDGFMNIPEGIESDLPFN